MWKFSSFGRTEPDCVTAPWGKEFVLSGSSLDLANEINSLGETFQRRDHITKSDLFHRFAILLICFNNVLTCFLWFYQLDLWFRKVRTTYVLSTYATRTPYKVPYFPLKGRIFPYEKAYFLRTFPVFGTSPKNDISKLFHDVLKSGNKKHCWNDEGWVTNQCFTAVQTKNLLKQQSYTCFFP